MYLSIHLSPSINSTNTLYCNSKNSKTDSSVRKCSKREMWKWHCWESRLRIISRISIWNPAALCAAFRCCSRNLTSELQTRENISDRLLSCCVSGQKRYERLTKYFTFFLVPTREYGEKKKKNMLWVPNRLVGLWNPQIVKFPWVREGSSGSSAHTSSEWLCAAAILSRSRRAGRDLLEKGGLMCLEAQCL